MSFTCNNEEWRPILFGAGKYEVSNLGRIRSTTGGRDKTRNTLPKTKTLTFWKNWNRYCLVTLHFRNAKKHFTVHSLVLTAFVGPRPDGCECAHLDNDRSNNRLDNLRWVTRKENHSHKIGHGTAQRGEKNGNHRFYLKDIMEIRKLYAEGHTQTEIAKMYSTRQSYIHAVVTKRLWKHF